MKKGIIGKKIGMTQIFDEKGNVIPVTVIEAGPCVVAQKKTAEKDGYDAVQLGFVDAKEKHLTKAEKGHFAKAGVANKRHLKEFRLDDCSAVNVGDVITADTFAAGDKVDVTGGGIILGMLGGRASGIAAANAVRDNDCSKEKLKEYEKLYGEATFKALPKIKVIKDLMDSFSDDDLNEIIEYFAALDLKGLSLSDAIKLFFKLSPRLTIKFRKLFKLIL